MSPIFTPPPILSAKGGQACTSISRGFLKIEWAADSVIRAGTRKHKDIDFEQELWSAADKLRGNIDAGEYKHVVLGLLFLKDVFDAFYMRRAEFETRLAAPKDKEQN